jgi:hypothetical protein
MIDVVEDKDDVFNTANNNDGDDADKKSVNNQEDTVDAVEDNGEDLNTDEKMTSDVVRFFFRILGHDLPSFFFAGVAYIFWLFLVMVSSMNECWKWG